MLEYASGTTTWGSITMDDVDGNNGAKGVEDINGVDGLRVGDGYVRVVDQTTGFGSVNRSWIQMAVSWNYFSSYSGTGLGQGQTWKLAAGIIADANDHNSIKDTGDVAGGMNSASLLSSGGWSAEITTVPEASATPLVMGGLAGLFALVRSRRKLAARISR